MWNFHDLILNTKIIMSYCELDEDSCPLSRPCNLIVIAMEHRKLIA